MLLAILIRLLEENLQGPTTPSNEIVAAKDEDLWVLVSNGFNDLDAKDPRYKFDELN